MKKKTAKTIIALVVALLVMIASVLTTGYILTGTANPFKWVKDKQTQPQPLTAWGKVMDDAGNEMNSAETYDMPSAILFYSTATPDTAASLNLAPPTVTVTASHNFELNNVEVDWATEYPSGANASDTVTVTPTKDGSLTATLQCRKQFEHPITLKVTLRSNPTKTATCKIDYVKRVESFTSFSLSGTDFEDSSGFSCTPIFGAGTVKGNLRVKQISYKLIDGFKTAVQNNLKFTIRFKDYTTGNFALNDTYYSYEGEPWAYSMFIESFDTYDQAHKNAIYFAWYTAYFEDFEGKSNVYFDYDIELLYNGKVIDNFQESDYMGTGENYLNGDCYGYDASPDLTLNGNVAL